MSQYCPEIKIRFAVRGEDGNGTYNTYDKWF